METIRVQKGWQPNFGWRFECATKKGTIISWFVFFISYRCQKEREKPIKKKLLGRYLFNAWFFFFFFLLKWKLKKKVWSFDENQINVLTVKFNKKPNINLPDMRSWCLPLALSPPPYPPPQHQMVFVSLPLLLCERLRPVLSTKMHLICKLFLFF